MTSPMMKDRNRVAFALRVTVEYEYFVFMATS
jgi:hypothetical protein